MKWNAYARGKRPERGQNKTEKAYAQQLELEMRANEIEWYKFEGIKLRMGKGAWFTPDFIVMRKTGEIEIHEVKGFMREAANVRLKVAAEMYPFPIYVVRLKNNRWNNEKI